MTDVVNLEQLNYRDQMIKEYIDQHSGGGSSDYVPISLALKRFIPKYTEDYDGDVDMQRLYLGVPAGYDVSQCSIEYMRYSKVNCRVTKIVDEEPRKETVKNYVGWHYVWNPEDKTKSLINITFIDSSNPSFSSGKQDFYELTGYFDQNNIYDCMFDYLNSGDPIYPMRKGICGIHLVKDGKIVSNRPGFRVSYNKSMEDFRMRLNLFRV